MSAAPARPKLAAQHREVTGKKVSYLRAAGRLPAVVFGRGIDSNSVSVDAHEFETLRRHAGANTLIDLSVDGGHTWLASPLAASVANNGSANVTVPKNASTKARVKVSCTDNVFFAVSPKNATISS